MELIEQSWQWVVKPKNILSLIEQIGTEYYQDESKMGHSADNRFVNMVVDENNISLFEHALASIRFITNRGVTHELVRHRFCSFSQESTRYVKYNKKMEFIKPEWWENMDYPEANKKIWMAHMEESEHAYSLLVEEGDHPEQAREVLPNSLKTEIVITTNLREWRHIFELRCSKKAHPQIRTLMINCLKGFHEEVPIIFDDLVVQFC